MAKAKGKSSGPTLPLDGVDCVITGMSLSFDLDGDDPVERRNLRLEGISRNEEQLDAHLGKYTHRSWFNTDASTKLQTPMTWWEKRESRDFPLSDKFNVESLEIKCGSRVLKFKSEQHEDGDGETPAGKIKDIVYAPQTGGISLMSMKLSVRPDPEQAALLTEYFKRHVKVTLGMISVQEPEKQTQGELAVSADQTTRDAAVNAVAGGGNGKPIDGTTPASRAKSKPAH